MKTTTLQATVGSAIVLLAAQPCHASSRQLGDVHHEYLSSTDRSNKRYGYTSSNAAFNPRYEGRQSEKQLQARSGAKCQFPSNKGLVAVTPDAKNGGWALAPDQECVDGTWCPIACPSGQLMAQWKPGTHYAFPESTYGGVYCDAGEIKIPFEDEPWCVDGTGTVGAVNNAGAVVSFCQTVLPGYEDMLIPTNVEGTTTLAVPNPSYWDSAAAHFYINPPGVGSDEGCHWGDASRPTGNWAPYVAGANTDSSGNTFVKLGINPVWQGSALYSDKPTFGLRIECDGNCNGLPCEINGNGVVSDEEATGAGGSDFCVATVIKGGKANIVIYNLDGSEGGVGGNRVLITLAPTSTSELSTTYEATSIATPSTTAISTTISTSNLISTSTTSSYGSITTPSTGTTFATTTIGSSSATTPLLGGVFYQNGTTSDADHLLNTPTATSALPADSAGESKSESGHESGSQSQSQSQSPSESGSTEQSKTGDAGRCKDGTAIAGFIVAFVAAVYLL